MKKMQITDGFIGGPSVCLALTKRAKTSLTAGPDDLSIGDAIDAVCLELVSSAARLGYLLDVASTEIGRRRGTLVTEKIASVFRQITSARDLAPNLQDRDAFVRRLSTRLRTARVPASVAEPLIKKVATAAMDGGADNDDEVFQDATIDISSEYISRRLVVSYGDQAVTVRESGGRASIGRSRDCDVPIKLRSVSRRHAVIFSQNGRFVIRDCSRNGTTIVPLDGCVVVIKKQEYELGGGGEILVGSEVTGETPAMIRWEILDPANFGKAF